MARVAIVSDNRETLDGLDHYLQRAGVETTCTRRVQRAAEISKGCSVVVLFPDDYEWGAVVAALSDCRRADAQSRAVVVTERSERFTSLVQPPALPELVIVPRPAWGWTILDAIRAKRNEWEGSGKP
jgi:hypothetical protein